ncbi:hypothetical protein ACIBI9_29315 [Nonomuraea sp. NPDC050451]|uniref:hypothetical protein n=1 Tax=Nonomuraea sp. NPDC050451 TaxID=3364364 RepID=UPI0037AE87DE
MRTPREQPWNPPLPLPPPDHRLQSSPPAIRTPVTRAPVRGVLSTVAGSPAPSWAAAYVILAVLRKPFVFRPRPA